MSQSRKTSRAALLALVVCALGALSASAAQAGTIEGHFDLPPESQVALKTSDTTPTIGFTASGSYGGGPVTYSCNVDHTWYAACGNPFTVTDPWSGAPLAPGRHNVDLVASARGSTDPTPAQLFVDVRPTSSFVYAPELFSRNRRPLFIYRSNGADSSFHCQIDSSVVFDCGRGNDSLYQPGVSLFDGWHLFRVYAQNPASSGGDRELGSHQWAFFIESGS